MTCSIFKTFSGYACLALLVPYTSSAVSSRPAFEDAAQTSIEDQDKDTSEQSPALSPPNFDHHVHVMSPDLVGRWKTLGVPFSREDRFYSDPQTFLPKSATEYALLVSMAHVYGSGDFGLDADETNRLIEAENDYLLKCATESNGRFAAFVSVRPFATPDLELEPWEESQAFTELERCVKSKHMIGIKLHLPACAMQLTIPESEENDEDRVGSAVQWTRLQQIFEWAAQSNQAILIHLGYANQDFGPQVAARFWKQLVAPACQKNPSFELYVAHLGFSGGYGTNAQALLEGLAQAKTTQPALSAASIFFDLSGAILPTPTDGLPETSPELCGELARQMRSAGLQHFVFASDYPVFDPAELGEALSTRIPLEKAEWERVFANKGPALDCLTRASQSAEH